MNSDILHGIMFLVYLMNDSIFLGGALKESGSANCFFQAFVEYLVGMKLSAVNQTQGMCISALHQSSGNSSIWNYYFNSLTLVYPYFFG